MSSRIWHVSLAAGLTRRIRAHATVNLDAGKLATGQLLGMRSCGLVCAWSTWWTPNGVGASLSGAAV